MSAASTRKRFFSSDMHNSFNGFASTASSAFHLNHSSFSELPLHFSPPRSTRSVPSRSLSASATANFFRRNRPTVSNDLDESNYSYYEYGGSRSRSGSPILGYCHSHNTGNPNNSTFCSLKHFVGVLGLISLSILGLSIYQHDLTLQDRLSAKNRELEAFAAHSDSLEQTMAKLREQTEYLNDKIEQLRDQQPPAVDLDTHRKLFHLRHAGQIMQTQIQETSKRLLLEKFGKGPRYYVEMRLIFDKDSAAYDETSNNSIIVETASLEQMPHAVYTFLEQVAHGMYDGTAFYRNAVHLMQAGPVTSEQQTRFREEPSLNSVMFPEYNNNNDSNSDESVGGDFAPHKAYTLGYPTGAGGAAKPDFYINVRDNSFVHGPDAVAATDRTFNNADPCFARVIRGFDVVDRLHKSETHDTSTMHDVMEHPVVIRNMRIRYDGRRLAPPGEQEQ